MTVHSGFINTLWLVLFAYWLVAAVGAKRNVGGRQGFTGRGLRLGAIVLGVLALRTLPMVRNALQSAQAYLAGRAIFGTAGVVVCALGIALAIWARVHLGRNWGMPMSAKESPELVTTGPYAYIRHPIYLGILLAMFGSMFGENVFWALPLVVFGAYFVYSARREEALMIGQFPQQYPPYMQRTGMLMPRLFRRS